MTVCRLVPFLAVISYKVYKNLIFYHAVIKSSGEMGV